MRKKIIFILFFFTIVPHQLYATEPVEILETLVLSKNKYINLKQEAEIAANFEILTESTLMEINKITPFSFKNRDDINAENASSLMYEVQKLKESLGQLQAVLKKLKAEKEEPQRAVLWVKVMQEFNYSQNYLDDLFQHSLVKNEDLARTSNISSPPIFDQIIIPRIIKLIATLNLCTSK